MIFQIQNLDETTVSTLPECCRGCAWWQGHDDGWPSEEAARAWASSAAEMFGYWGKLAVGDDDLLGFIQFGPAILLDRARELCDATSRDSFLLACSNVAGPEVESVRKSLILATLAELREREVENLDAFCHAEEDAVDDCRLFSRSFLSGCGFYPVKRSGDVVLMRLELGGLQPLKPQREKARRLLERIKRKSPAPSPAALCRKGRARAGVTPVS